MAEEIQLSLSHKIGDNQPAFIIAEVGQNHQGDLNVAKKLIEVAKQSGADCVKFQKTCLDEKFNKKALNRPYNNPNSWGATYGEHKKHLEFTFEEFCKLQNYATELDILFTASAMDFESLYFLQSIDVPFIKIGSGDSNNLLLIKEAASTKIPLVISTGMQNLNGVRTIYECVKKIHKKFAILHCISSYPPPLAEINLKVINLFKSQFPDIVVGYSGHEIGTDITLAAVTLGAKIIERHITLNKNQKGSDHKSSLEPKELECLIKRIRMLEIALGKPEKRFQGSEKICYKKLGKTIVASKNLKKDHYLQLEDLKVKVAEPKGQDASLILEVVGKRLKVDIDEDESIFENYLE